MSTQRQGSGSGSAQAGESFVVVFAGFHRPWGTWISHRLESHGHSVVLHRWDPRREVPEVIRRMQERLGRPDARDRAPKMWTATYILMGLRYEQAFTARLFEEIATMEESVTYQAIIAKGAKQEARKLLLRQGHLR